MKKTTLTAIAIAAAAAAAAASGAHAQSSVTLYGIIDAGVNYLSNAQTGKGPGGLVGKSSVSLADGAMGAGGSRFGLRGSEDLGGGLSAIFTLENGFSANSGGLAQGGLLFGRQAFVGLSSNQYGTLTLGRQYSVVTDTLAPISLAGDIPGHLGSSPDDFNDMGRSNRINNTIKYRSPTFAGVTVTGMYSLGGVAGATGQKQVWALAAGYQQGPLSAGVGYLNAKNPNLSIFGTNGNAGPATTNNMGSAGSATAAQSNPVFSGFASAGSMELIVAGAKYNFGAGDVGATFSHVGFNNLGDLASGPNPLHYAGNAVLNNGEINAGYNLTPAIRVSAAYDYTRKASVGAYGGATYQQGTLAADYTFSKRTMVYLLAIYQHASGTDSLGQSAVASITQLTPSATGNQTLIRLGLVQKF